MEEFISDPAIHAHCPRHIMNVTTNLVAEVGDLVDERDFRGQKRVGGILRQFCRLQRSYDYWCFNQIERAVKIPHDGDGLLISASYQNPVGSHKIINRRALP